MTAKKKRSPASMGGTFEAHGDVITLTSTQHVFLSTLRMYEVEDGVLTPREPGYGRLITLGLAVVADKGPPAMLQITPKGLAWYDAHKAQGKRGAVNDQGGLPGSQGALWGPDELNAETRDPCEWCDDGVDHEGLECLNCEGTGLEPLASDWAVHALLSIPSLTLPGGSVDRAARVSRRHDRQGPQPPLARHRCAHHGKCPSLGGACDS